MFNRQLRLNGLFGGIDIEKKSNEAILFVFVLVLGIVLRFYDLGGESFWLDEVATTIEVKQSILALLKAGRLDEPPVYYILIDLWAKLFGVSEVGLRSFSALAGVGSIILIYLVGKRLFGKEVGLLGAFFMTISDFQILYSQEARNYSLFEFAVLLSFFFFIIYLDGGKKIHFVFYIVFSILMVYSNAFGVFVIIAQNLFFVLHIRKYVKLLGIWFVGQALIVLAVIPYFSPILFGGGGLEGAVDSNLEGLPMPSYSDVLRSVYRFILPPRRYFGMDMEWGDFLLWIYAVAGGCFMVGTLIHAARHGVSNWLAAMTKLPESLKGISEIRRNILLVSCWLLCPPVLLVLILPVYDHKYVISAASAFYLLLALCIWSMRKVIPLLISVGVLIILTVPGLGHYYTADVRDQWKEAAAFLEKNGGQNEVIVFAPNDSGVNVGNQQKAFNYYYRGPLPSCGIGPEELTDAEVWDILMQCVSGYDRFWVVVRSPTPGNRYKLFFLNTSRTSLHLIKEQQFVLLDVYLFEIKK